ncbi:MAG TPA: aminodeoxychorismate/anthranilate synthase component II [Deltaproteobacteria bacterium]|nr:aminodeoxychorismate/anthranilate synthase component II [Deltaproteobacteria bacterium]HOM29565.1 aminodeoxychorismate/anthranilate synthase component II [Deltaproteobacteria bacterium]HPP81111.1 aminodeoxychorismate/anthranilate synthase component II [Deltaproteobacteria bacterium]
MTLVIDNYDSFTFNLVQILAARGVEVVVRRNDEIGLSELDSMMPEAVVISPGPGDPTDAGISVSAVEHLAGRVPILGVCLGHQCIAHAFGARIVHAKRVMHGKLSPISHDGTGLFEGLPDNFPAVRYHSLAVDGDSLPSSLRVCARAYDDGEIMGLCNEHMRLYGVQFHPESIATEFGEVIMERFIALSRRNP